MMYQISAQRLVHQLIDERRKVNKNKQNNWLVDYDDDDDEEDDDAEMRDVNSQ